MSRYLMNRSCDDHALAVDFPRLITPSTLTRASFYRLTPFLLGSALRACRIEGSQFCLVPAATSSLLLLKVVDSSFVKDAKQLCCSCCPPRIRESLDHLAAPNLSHCTRRHHSLHIHSCRGRYIQCMSVTGFLWTGYPYNLFLAAKVGSTTCLQSRTASATRRPASRAR